MKQSIVFVYAKNGKVKVVSDYYTQKQHLALGLNGWKHTQTLDACIFIENLINNDLYSEFRDW